MHLLIVRVYTCVSVRSALYTSVHTVRLKGLVTL
jgi:hypothetical protein